MTSDMKKYRYVLTLAEELNFSRAAQKLQITQPTLSQHINKLETELGIALFDRSSSCIKLTDAGEIYVDGIRSVYEKLGETMDRIYDAENNGVCHLSIGTSPSLCHYIMPSVVAKIKEKYPRSVINIHEGTTTELNALLEKGVVDITLCVTDMDNQGVSKEIVYDEKIALAVAVKSPSYDAIKSCAKDGSVSFKGVGNSLSFITLQDDQMLTKTLKSLCRECKISANITLSVTELTTAIEMMKGGVGVMLVPSTFKHYLEADKGIAFFNLDELGSSRSIAVHYRRDKYLTNIARYYIDCLKSLDF